MTATAASLTVSPPHPCHSASETPVGEIVGERQRSRCIDPSSLAFQMPFHTMGFVGHTSDAMGNSSKPAAVWKAYAPSLLLLPVAVGLLVASCHSPASWLEGKWVLDSEYTQRQWEQAQAEQGQASGPEALGQALGGLAGGLLLVALADVTFVFDGNEVIVLQANGNGEAHTFEVVEAPDADTLIIKKDNGEISTWYRDGDRIATVTDGGVHLKVYLKRAP